MSNKATKTRGPFFPRESSKHNDPKLTRRPSHHSKGGRGGGTVGLPPPGRGQGGGEAGGGRGAEGEAEGVGEAGARRPRAEAGVAQTRGGGAWVTTTETSRNQCCGPTRKERIGAVGKAKAGRQRTRLKWNCEVILFKKNGVSKTNLVHWKTSMGYRIYLGG